MKLLSQEALQQVAGGGNLSISLEVPKHLEEEVTELIHEFMSGGMDSLEAFGIAVASVPGIQDVTIRTIAFDSRPHDFIAFANPPG